MLGRRVEASLGQVGASFEAGEVKLQHGAGELSAAGAVPDDREVAL